MKNLQQIAHLVEAKLPNWQVVSVKGTTYPWRENDVLMGFVDLNHVSCQMPYENKLTYDEETQLKADIIALLTTEQAEKPTVSFGSKGYGKWRDILISWNDRLSLVVPIRV